jgi:hypothetical protein
MRGEVGSASLINEDRLFCSRHLRKFSALFVFCRLPGRSSWTRGLNLALTTFLDKVPPLPADEPRA